MVALTEATSFLLNANITKVGIEEGRSDCRTEATLLPQVYDPG